MRETMEQRLMRRVLQVASVGSSEGRRQFLRKTGRVSVGAIAAVAAMSRKAFAFGCEDEWDLDWPQCMPGSGCDSGVCLENISCCDAPDFSSMCVGEGWEYNDGACHLNYA
jgi:hypothetical protein